MGKHFKNSVSEACRMLLRPVATLLLKCGMTWKEFSELSKAVFVEMATSEFGIKGRPTNISRVSLMTGISRKEVKRQRDLLANLEPETSGKTTDATRMLSGWHQDTEYLDANGSPLELDETGPAPSFDTLFARYGGDIPKVAMLKELTKTAAVKQLPGGRLRVMSRYYQPVAMAPESLTLIFGQSMQDLASVIENNIAGDKESTPRFQGYADDRHIDPQHLADFNDLLEKEGQQFLERIDAWLAEHRVASAESNTTPVRLGVGIYAIGDPQKSIDKGKIR